MIKNFNNHNFINTRFYKILQENGPVDQWQMVRATRLPSPATLDSHSRGHGFNSRQVHFFWKNKSLIGTDEYIREIRKAIILNIKWINNQNN